MKLVLSQFRFSLPRLYRVKRIVRRTSWVSVRTRGKWHLPRKGEPQIKDVTVFTWKRREGDRVKKKLTHC